MARFKPTRKMSEEERRRIVAAGLSKLSPAFQTPEQTDEQRVMQKFMNVHREVAIVMKNVIEEAQKSGKLFDRKANTELFARCYIERFDKFSHDELVHVVSQLVTEMVIDKM